ncbi:hypothetical protein JTB14_004392 [Gonioctena quinquepunctata]|nr:hypothetical protein JTB14_004392 [Gonioctena quinquepunctata]
MSDRSLETSVKIEMTNVLTNIKTSVQQKFLKNYRGLNLRVHRSPLPVGNFGPLGCHQASTRQTLPKYREMDKLIKKPPLTLEYRNVYTEKSKVQVVI